MSTHQVNIQTDETRVSSRPVAQEGATGISALLSTRPVDSLSKSQIDAAKGQKDVVSDPLADQQPTTTPKWNDLLFVPGTAYYALNIGQTLNQSAIYVTTINGQIQKDQITDYLKKAYSFADESKEIVVSDSIKTAVEGFSGIFIGSASFAMLAWHTREGGLKDEAIKRASNDLKEFKEGRILNQKGLGLGSDATFENQLTEIDLTKDSDTSSIYSSSSSTSSSDEEFDLQIDANDQKGKGNQLVDPKKMTPREKSDWIRAQKAELAALTSDASTFWQKKNIQQQALMQIGSGVTGKIPAACIDGFKKAPLVAKSKKKEAQMQIDMKLLDAVGTTISQYFNFMNGYQQMVQSLLSTQTSIDMSLAS